MSTFKTQVLKDAAVAKQQDVVDNATPSTVAEERAELADLQAATITG